MTWAVGNARVARDGVALFTARPKLAAGMHACSKRRLPEACRSPSWLAEPNKLWPQWKLAGDELAAAKADATLLALKEQEDAGIDIVTDGEMSRQHFVHGFLEFVDGIDFAHKVEMGIRADRYKAMVPQVVGELRLKGRVHATEARLARAHTTRKLKITMPGPMTIIDTIADRHYGDRVKMAMAFAALLNQEARALRGRRRRRDPVRRAGLQRLHGRGRRTGGSRRCTARSRASPARTAVHICYGYGIKANIDWKATLGARVAAVREGLSGARAEPHRAGLARVPQLARCR